MITGPGAVTFIVPGKAKRKERPFFGKGQVFSRPATRVAEAVIAAIAQPLFPEPSHGTVALEIISVWPMPVGWSKRKRTEQFSRPVARKPDWDQTGKVVSDALNGIAYADDAQVADARVVRIWGINARTLVCVQDLGEAA